MHMVSKDWIFFFFSISKQSPYFTAIEEDGVEKRPAEFEFACETDGIAPPASVQSGQCCHCRGNPGSDFCRAGAMFAQGCSQVFETGPLTSGRSLLIFALILFVLWAMILLFYVLTSIPYAVALSMRLWMRS